MPWPAPRKSSAVVLCSISRCVQFHQDVLLVVQKHLQLTSCKHLTPESQDLKQIENWPFPGSWSWLVCQRNGAHKARCLVERVKLYLVCPIISGDKIPIPLICGDLHHSWSCLFSFNCSAVSLSRHSELWSREIIFLLELPSPLPWLLCSYLNTPNYSSLRARYTTGF